MVPRGRYSSPTLPRYPDSSRSRRNSPIGCVPVPGWFRPGTSAICTCATSGAYRRNAARASAPALPTWYWSSCSLTDGDRAPSTSAAARSTVSAKYPGMSIELIASTRSVTPACSASGTAARRFATAVRSASARETPAGGIPASTLSSFVPNRRAAATPSLVRSAGRRPIHRDPGGFFPEPDQRGHVLIRQTSRGGLEEALLRDRAEQQRDLRALRLVVDDPEVLQQQAHRRRGAEISRDEARQVARHHRRSAERGADQVEHRPRARAEPRPQHGRLGHGAGVDADARPAPTPRTRERPIPPSAAPSGSPRRARRLR